MKELLGFLIAVEILTGCNGNKEWTTKFTTNYSDSLTKQISSIKKSKKAKAYAYWQTARKLINLCKDTQQLHSHKIEDIDHQYLIPAIAKCLKNIPTKGVDTVAVRSIQSLANNLEGISKMNKEVTQNEAKFGVKAGIFVISILAGGIGDDGGEISDDGDAAGDVVNSDADGDENIQQDGDNDNSFDAGKHFGSGVVGIYQEQKAISEIMDRTNAELQTASKLLHSKYHKKFAIIQITKSHTDYVTSVSLTK